MQESSQQTPSAQKPVAHWLPLVHDWPLATRGWHWMPSQ